MPLLDHFRPPLSISHPWMGFHSAWATAMAQQLNGDLLPAEYYAIPNVQLGGQVEIDVATLEQSGTMAADDGAVATAVWAPPRPALVLPIDFAHLDVFEVQVLQDFGGPQLRAAIELVSPANKDRPSHRNAFAIKCASYLQRGVSVVIVDVVTERQANLHAALLGVLGQTGQPVWSSPSNLYALAYRAGQFEGQDQLEAWPERLDIAGVLPTLPLWLNVDLCVPFNLEESYDATCESLRIHH
jgi:hypothetical protein